jgi:hypothetical protein
MIKKLLSIALIFTGLTIKAQSFTATYNFALTTSVSGTTDPSIPPTSTSVSFGAFSAVGTSTSSTASGRFSFTNWPTGATTGIDSYSTMTGALDPAKYYEVSIIPAIGYEMTLDNLSFDVRRSGSGIRNYAVRSSVDSYTANLMSSVISNTNISIVGNNEFFWNLDATSTSSDQSGSFITLGGLEYTNKAAGVTFRFYGWNAEQSGGTFSIDNVTFLGSASVITGLGKLKFDLNSDLNIYPVPNHDGILFIESKNVSDVSKIEVLDVLGNIVLSNHVKNEARIKLNLAEMPSGSYFVRLYAGKSVSTKKIAIVK